MITVSIETRNKLDDAVIAAVESGKLIYGDSKTADEIKISDTLTLEFRLYNDNVAPEAQLLSPHWALVKRVSQCQLEKCFPLGHLVVKALNKLRSMQLMRVDESNDSKITAEYNEIIGEIEGL